MISLTKLSVGENAVIVEIKGGLGFKKRLESLNLRKGKSLRKISSAPFHGPVVIEIGGCKIAIGQGMASKILVEVAHENTFNG
ncbi:FeoA family protein [Methanobacterium aggregans]|uniref:FeoA family protein n=1 Tax=Methanobacterium aggregans TaxID=1615586 RepID=UPI001AE9C01E|nr:FeoA family protein [Methanobacterium aggregans]MBP2046674.1 Fe2+ transport system protein FeoA [Methanobacterium aggregans]